MNELGGITEIDNTNISFHMLKVSNTTQNLTIINYKVVKVNKVFLSKQFPQLGIQIWKKIFLI